MTEQNQISLPDEVLNTILTEGLDGLPEAVSLLINHAMLEAWRQRPIPPISTSSSMPATKVLWLAPTTDHDLLQGVDNAPYREAEGGARQSDWRSRHT